MFSNVYVDLEEWDNAAACFEEATRLLETYGSGKLSRKVGLIHAQHDALVNSSRTVEAFALQSKHPEAFTIE